MSEGVRCVCKTDLMYEWPERLAAVPAVGDWIAPKNGRPLSVIRVTHHGWDSAGDEAPWIEVLLGEPMARFSR